MIVRGESTCFSFLSKICRVKISDYKPKVRWISSSPQGSVRVRFAPSPTGLLHLGGFRTALLNYLYVIKYGGQFILRIEDTDQTRLVPDALKNIETDLRWLGIVPTEGPSNPGKWGPYIQSERLSIYHENLSKLIEEGHAYECFCSEKRLDLLRREAMRLKQKPRYDNKCRDLTRDEVKGKKASGESHCVRFKLSEEESIFNDLVYGPVEHDMRGMNYDGDPIIMKTDGFPTYHFANVVDDHYMEITHVLRGVEWQVSTPKHLQMFRAFNWKPPTYAHLPLVLNQDGSKLSKRQGDVSIRHYRDQTFYPVALINFVTKSGGGFAHQTHDVDRLYSLKELAEHFQISEVNQGGCRLDFVLLDKLNQLALADQIKTDPTLTLKKLSELLKNNNIIPTDYHPDYLTKILNWSSSDKRLSKLHDLVSPDFEYLWSQPNPTSLSKVKLSPSVIQDLIKSCVDDLYKGPEITDQSVSDFLTRFCEIHELKHNGFLRDLRSLLCGITKGPPIVEIFHLFGKDMILDRLNKSLDHLSPHSSKSVEC